MESRDPVRTYYAALDEGEYDALAAVLAEGFVHERPDRTFEGREAFLEFMREGRPLRATTHEVRERYRNEDGSEAVARGVLRGEDGEELFAFLDLHVLTDDGERIARLRTYTPGRS